MAWWFLFLFVFAALASRASSCEIFQSRDPIVRSVISACTGGNSLNKVAPGCRKTLRCVLDGISSDTAARWSAGSSILAFIPTIVGLMSNSINEVTAIAEESTMLAILLCFSSATAFSSRFEDKTSKNILGRSEQSFSEQRALDEILAFIRSNRPKGTQWWRKTKVQNMAVAFVLLGLSAGLWFEIYELSRYGIIVFACPVKVNIIIWAGLTQILGLSNIALRHHLFDIRKIQIRNIPAAQPLQSAGAEGCMTCQGHVSRNLAFITALEDGGTQCLTIILRSPRSTQTRWLLQTLTAVISYSLYTFGTSVLASVTMIPASDAIRATVVLCIGAGFGRIIGYWTGSFSRAGRLTILVDVPATHMDHLAKAIKHS